MSPARSDSPSVVTGSESSSLEDNMSSKASLEVVPEKVEEESHQE